MKLTKRIKKLLCPHKRIDICGVGDDGKEVYTRFMCVNCYKVFRYYGRHLDVMNITPDPSSEG